MCNAIYTPTIRYCAFQKPREKEELNFFLLFIGCLTLIKGHVTVVQRMLQVNDKEGKRH